MTSRGTSAMRPSVAMWICVVAVALSGCSSTTDAIFDMAKYVGGFGGSDADRARLNPEYRYLRVQIDGRVALLVLGYVDPDPLGPVEVWYSASKEVLRLQHGRLVGATGMTTEWRNVAVKGAPEWTMIRPDGEAVAWSRSVDLMPGYRYGIRHQMSLRRTLPVTRTALRGLDPDKLEWYEESATEVAGTEISVLRAGSATQARALPMARYAAQAEPGTPAGVTIVYGEQCLSPDLCFSWQRWPPVPQGPASE